MGVISGIVYAVALLVVSATAKLQYSDEFDTFDKSKWFIEVVSNPHNNELQYYTERSDNVRVEAGHLVITPLKENYGGRQYTSARIHSNFAWKYGRVEVRAKLPDGYGLWPAIWMMPRDSVYGGWPQSGEIDILEARGQNLNKIASTIHYGDVCCDNHYWETSGDLETQCSIDNYHVYSLDWTPTQLVYRLDGKAYFTQDLDRVIGWMYKNPGEPFNEYFYMILNVAIGGDYLDNPKPDTEWSYPNAQMWVDYVRVYPLEDISTNQCAVNPDASVESVCGNIDWACNTQNYADVSAQCTTQLAACCDAPSQCDRNQLNEMASAVFAEYDRQVNDAHSCEFSGAAEKTYVLNDGDTSDLQTGACLIYDGADSAAICDGMIWACYSQSYADVSEACGAGQDVLSCCGSNSCDDTRLRQAAQSVFQSYYDQLPSPSSCDFGGVCHLENPLYPLECHDGYGA